MAKILNDNMAPTFDLFAAIQEAGRPFVALHKPDWEREGLGSFLFDRRLHLYSVRGAQPDVLRVVASKPSDWGYPRSSLKLVNALSHERASAEFQAVAGLFKRVKNITKGMDGSNGDLPAIRRALKEPAEIELADELQKRRDVIREAVDKGQYAAAIKELSAFHSPVDRFFTDVLVMADDEGLKRARLGLLTVLRDTVMDSFGDISEMAAETEKQA